MNKKLLLIGAFVVVLLGVAIYWVSSHPNTPFDHQTYTSDKVSFSYPTTYKLEARSDSFEGKQITVLTLMDKNVKIPDMSEGPPAISVIVVPNPENLSLEEWVSTKSISNFYLSPDKKLAATTVAGEPAVRYSHTGLYESDAVAVVHAGSIYLFSAGWAQANDPIRAYFLNLVSSVQFK